MIYTVSLTDKINFSPRTEEEEILQNFRTIIKTRKGTVPLDRDFGLSWSWIDKPFQVAKSLLIAEIHEVAEEYEPRAKILSIGFDENTADTMEGIMSAKIKILIGEDNELEDL